MILIQTVNELSETFTSTPTKPRLSFPEPTSWLLIYPPLIPIAQAQAQGPSPEQRPGPSPRPKPRAAPRPKAQAPVPRANHHQPPAQLRTDENGLTLIRRNHMGLPMGNSWACLWELDSTLLNVPISCYQLTISGPYLFFELCTIDPALTTMLSTGEYQTTL